MITRLNELVNNLCEGGPGSGRHPEGGPKTYHGIGMTADHPDSVSALKASVRANNLSARPDAYAAQEAHAKAAEAHDSAAKSHLITHAARSAHMAASRAHRNEANRMQPKTVNPY